MNLITRRVLDIAVLAAASFCTVLSADAQNATFNLPFEAQWGDSILPPGEYHINVPLAQDWPQVISLSLGTKVVKILPLTECPVTSSKGSYLQLTKVRGKYFVREYNSASTGKQFTFRVPKQGAKELRVEAQARTIHPEGSISN